MTSTNPRTPSDLIFVEEADWSNDHMIDLLHGPYLEQVFNDWITDDFAVALTDIDCSGTLQ